jgi:hypothetical protein
VNAFLQFEFTPETSIQAEYRYRATKDGDLQLRFFADDFFPRLRQQGDSDSIRVGFHQTLWPGSDLIGNLMYQKADRSWRDSPDPILRLATLDGKDEAFSGEVQHLFNSKYIKTVAGVGYFKINSEDDYYSELFFPPATVIPDSFVIPRDVNHTNLYLYSYINFPRNVIFTIGASGDFVHQQLPDYRHKDINQFNPKFGITWNPFEGTTLRAAAFRVLKRTLITDQTLEPTQVAGFNQFFDDWNYTKSWRYGIAVDQKFCKSIFGGLEYSYRDMEVPYTLNTVPAEVREVDWNENVGRAYLYWTPYKWFALTAEYLYERVRRDKEFALGAEKIDTHRVPLGINFYHPSGLSATFKGIYVYQKGSFERQSPTANGVYIDGNDNFWLFDAAINYRLPKRYGFVTVGVRNMFDQKFNYYDTDWQNPAIQPGRFFYGKITLALP